MSKRTLTSHLVGLTLYKRKRRIPPMSTTCGENRGKPAKLVSYCPECPPKHPADPEFDVHVTVSEFAKAATGPCGHTWEIA